jgi:hypothetical protein
VNRVLAVSVVAAVLAGCQLAPRAAEPPREPGITPEIADLDGDGRRDEAHIGRQGARVWLVVDLATGKRLDLLLTGLPTGTVDSPRACMGSAICKLSGLPDLNRDGKHELAVQLDSGAYMATIGFFRVHGRAIHRIRLARSDHPFVLLDGASVRYGGTYRCRSGARVVDFGWGNDIDAQHRSAVTERTYRFDGERFIFVSERERLEPQSAGYPPPLSGRPC